MLTYPVVNMPRFRLGQVGTGESPRADCTKLGVNDTQIMKPELQAAMEKARAAGLQVVPVAGRLLNQGTQNEIVETVYWACPPQSVKEEMPNQASPQVVANRSGQAATAVPPAGGAPAPSAFPTTTVLAVGGLAAAGMIAFLALR